MERTRAKEKSMEVIITAVLNREFRLLQWVVKKSNLNEGGYSGGKH